MILRRVSPGNNHLVDEERLCKCKTTYLALQGESILTFTPEMIEGND
jgi:hypothetical protein